MGLRPSLSAPSVHRTARCVWYWKKRAVLSSVVFDRDTVWITSPWRMKTPFWLILSG